MLNFFIDLKLFELDGHAAYLRGGRQELNYGSQRLISQTDFPNSSRNFDGVKGFWHSDTWEVDAFWTRPVVINPDDFDSENDKETFAGVWTKYKPTKNQSLDLYYLYLDNATPIAAPPAGSRGGFDVNTFGAAMRVTRISSCGTSRGCISSASTPSKRPPPGRRRPARVSTLPTCR